MEVSVKTCSSIAMWRLRWTAICPCLVRVEDVDVVGGVGDEHLSAVGAVLNGRDAGTPLARRRAP